MSKEQEVWEPMITWIAESLLRETDTYDTVYISRFLNIERTDRGLFLINSTKSFMVPIYNEQTKELRQAISNHHLDRMNDCLGGRYRDDDRGGAYLKMLLLRFISNQQRVSIPDAKEPPRRKM